MPTETVTKTIVCPLETSTRKNERVRTVIDEWQAIASRMADLMPSFGPDHWRTQDTTLYRAVKAEFPDHGLRSHDASQAAYKVGEAFGSWYGNGRPGNRPRFGDGNYARFCHCGVDVEANDRGYGLKVGLAPYTPEWFHIRGGAYQREWLERIVDGDASTGSAELHLTETGDLTAHLAVTHDVEVAEYEDVDTVVGVDLGERTMYASAAVNGSVQDVTMRSGREFRHHRDRMRAKREALMAKGDLRGLQQLRDEHDRYTDHMTHVASREIVDFAAEHRPCAIHLESLTGYRDGPEDAIHDWPFAAMQTNICYKATEAGIPVKTIDPADTSITCRQCGHVDPRSRDGSTFACVGCGYEVHADVNAAINIAV